jgi:peroxiredoxin
MYRATILNLILLFLFSCSKNTMYEKYENTKWTGPYGPWHMSVYIDKVDGNYFEGEMHKPAGRIAYFEGTFLGKDSLIFTELYHVLGRGLVMDGTYPGVIIGDTLKGICNFFNIPLPDTTLHKYNLIRDRDFIEKTEDQKIVTRIFQKTKHLTKQIYAMVPWNKSPYAMLNDSTKPIFVDLIRDKRDIIDQEYNSIADEEIKKTLSDQIFYDTQMIWRIAGNPVDSLRMIKEIDKFEEGDDHYFAIQRKKFRLTKTSPDKYKDFLLDMVTKKLSVVDQVGLLYELSSLSQSEKELEPIFQKKYASLKAARPEDESLKKLDEILRKRKLSQRLKAGVKAPEFKIETLKGKHIKLSDFRGKFVFLDFWGSWCGPCRREIPNIKKLNETISKDKLQILGLAKDKITDLTKYINENDITYPNAWADDEFLSKYGITAFPTTFLIAPDGKIVAKNLRGEKLVELVREKMEEYK